MLELFIFEKICSTPFLGSHESILMASNEEDLRKAIYTLDDEGHFKESEEDKIKRLCNKPVKIFFPDQAGNDCWCSSNVPRTTFKLLRFKSVWHCSKVKSFKSTSLRY